MRVEKAWFAILAALLWQMAADAGPEDDLKRGIEAYDRGDVVSAVAVFRKAAEQGYAPAQVRLAYILDESEQNVEARKWYQRAAEQGNPDGQFGLGQMYWIGEGGDKDEARAFEWISKAAEGGLTAAMRTLAVSYEQGGMGLPKDAAQAHAWLERAAEHGDRWAKQHLAQTPAN
ncbi:MAG: tetratricopeptide repeat protein [Gammaproteobacteria bacterium]